MFKSISTSKAPAALGPYSQGVETQSYIFLSGQIPLDPVDGAMAQGIEAQTHQVFRNIKAVLSEAGLSMNNIIKTTVFLQDISDFGKMNEVYAQYFKAPYPARSAVEVAAIPKGALIEIECIAIKDNNN